MRAILAALWRGSVINGIGIGLAVLLILWVLAVLAVPVKAAELTMTGIASVYVDHRVACRGEQYDATALKAAHKTLPCGTHVRVTHQKNGKSVVVAINDRGPYIAGRIIDLTPAAAREIGLGWSIAPVRIEIVQCPPGVGDAALVQHRC